MEWTALRWPEKKLYYKENAFRLFQLERACEVRRPFSPLVFDANVVDWASDPNEDRTWRLYFHSLYWLNAPFWGLDKGNLPENEAEEVIAFVHEAIIGFCDYFELAGQDGPDSIWDDHSASYRVSYLSLVYMRYLKGRLSASEEEKLRKIIHVHLEKLQEFMDNPKWDNSNHRLFQIEGFCDGYIAFFPAQEIAFKQAILVASGKFQVFVNENISLQDGTTKEHATFYHAFLMGRINASWRYLENLGAHFDIDFQSLFRNMNRFLWTISPSPFHIPGVGDTKHDMKFDKNHVAPFCTDEFDDGTMSYIMSDGKEGIRPARLTQFTDDGYYVFRNGDIEKNELYSIFLEKQYIGPHGHVDGSSFITYYDKCPVLVDSGGPFRYGVKLRYHYFQTQLAHNTVIVCEPRRYLTKVRQAECEENISYVEAIADMGEGRYWSRLFAHVGDDMVAVVDYVSGCKSGCEIDQRFLVAPDFSLSCIANNDYYLASDKITATLRMFGPEGKNSARIEGIVQKNADLYTGTPLGNEASLIAGYSAAVTSVDTKYLNCALVQGKLVASTPRLTILSFKHGYEATLEKQSLNRYIIGLSVGEEYKIQLALKYQESDSGLNLQIEIQ